MVMAVLMAPMGLPAAVKLTRSYDGKLTDFYDYYAVPAPKLSRKGTIRTRGIRKTPLYYWLLRIRSISIAPVAPNPSLHTS